jgi:hypothetical protein
MSLATADRAAGPNGAQHASDPELRSANHKLPYFFVAVGLGHVQLRRAHLIRMEMSTCIEQRLYVVFQTCACSQE